MITFILKTKKLKHKVGHITQLMSIDLSPYLEVTYLVTSMTWQKQGLRRNFLKRLLGSPNTLFQEGNDFSLLLYNWFPLHNWPLWATGSLLHQWFLTSVLGGKKWACHPHRAGLWTCVLHGTSVLQCVRHQIPNQRGSNLSMLHLTKWVIL